MMEALRHVSSVLIPEELGTKGTIPNLQDRLRMTDQPHQQYTTHRATKRPDAKRESPRSAILHACCYMLMFRKVIHSEDDGIFVFGSSQTLPYAFLPLVTFNLYLFIIVKLKLYVQFFPDMLASLGSITNYHRQSGF